MKWALRPDMTLACHPQLGYVSLQKKQPDHPLKFRLHPVHGLIFALFDGTRTDREIMAILVGISERKMWEAKSLVNHITTRYRQFLVPPDPETPPRTWEFADFLFNSDYDFKGNQREAAPISLSWIVTEDCNRKCSYCYKDAVFIGDRWATDTKLPLPRVMELIEEAADIGITRIILSGGEPFLRPDLIEIIEAMVAHNMTVVPITKARIEGEAMARLARSGLEALHVSLDSADLNQVTKLTGVATAFDDMVATLAAAQERGLPVVLRPLMTKHNIENMEALIAFAYDYGVRQFRVDIYGQTCGRHDPSLLLTPTQKASVPALSKRITAAYPDIDITLHFENTEEMAALTGMEPGCMEGIRGLTFLPDGRAVKCEHWRFGNQLDFGNLNHCSILDVWMGEAIEKINFSERDAFQGTACFKCKQRDRCNDVRGRCSLSSLVGYGQINAPDCYCPIGAFKPTSKTAMVV